MVPSYERDPVRVPHLQKADLLYTLWTKICYALVGVSDLNVKKGRQTGTVLQTFPYSLL